MTDYAEEKAKREQKERADRLKTEPTEKYNYLAAAEMSMEDNYDMIDGIPNNGFDYKPSIIEQLRRFKPKTPDLTGKPGTAAGRDELTL